MVRQFVARLQAIFYHLLTPDVRARLVAETRGGGLPCTALQLSVAGEFL
jgi:hypothetical protein